MTLSIFLVILGYLMGSICSAIIVCRTFGLPDPREEGSKNPGATNVLRIAGKKYAIMVMVADVLKGTIPVVIAKAFDAEPIIVAFTALAAVIGHMYPVFFDFKGGKGVATAIGALLGFHFIIGVMVAATWLLIARFTRYSSLASIVSITLAPFYTLLLVGRLDVFPPLFFMVLLIVFKHKNNITRLIDGHEPKIKLKQNVMQEIIDETPDTETSGKETTQESAQIIPLTPKTRAIPKKTDIKKETETKEKKPKTAAKKAKVTPTTEPTKKAKTTKPKAKKPKPETPKN